MNSDRTVYRDPEFNFAYIDSLTDFLEFILEIKNVVRDCKESRKKTELFLHMKVAESFISLMKVIFI